MRKRLGERMVCRSTGARHRKCRPGNAELDRLIGGRRVDHQAHDRQADAGADCFRHTGVARLRRWCVSPPDAGADDARRALRRVRRRGNRRPDCATASRAATRANCDTRSSSNNLFRFEVGSRIEIAHFEQRCAHACRGHRKPRKRHDRLATFAHRRQLDGCVVTECTDRTHAGNNNTTRSRGLTTQP